MLLLAKAIAAIVSLIILLNCVLFKLTGILETHPENAILARMDDIAALNDIFNPAVAFPPIIESNESNAVL